MNLINQQWPISGHLPTQGIRNIVSAQTILLAFVLTSSITSDAFGDDHDISPFCVVQNIRAGSTLSVRSEPGLQGARVGYVDSDTGKISKRGTTYSNQHGDWIKIESNRVSGWASADYLDCEEADDFSVLEHAGAIVSTLSARDFEMLASYVHPMKGVRLSPYAFIDSETDQVLQANQISSAGRDKKAILWGYFDGTGDPIHGTFDEYYELFLYSREFTDAPYQSLDVVMKKGATVDNSDAVYPNARIVEYHFPSTVSGSPGWESLRIVLEWHEDDWRLIGLIHDQWTT